MNHLSVDGILLIYRYALGENASTIKEHIGSFKKYSNFKVWEVNTEFGFPGKLSDMQFRVVLLHYSLFGQPYLMSEGFYRYLRETKAYKIAFFQDEYHYCQTRFRFLNDYRIDCVYTLLEPPYFSEVYEKNTCVSRMVYTLPGYVDETLILQARQRMLPDEDRTIDVGYRARPLAWYMGAGAKEKIDIALNFLKYTQGRDLRLDIDVSENGRLYGEDWYRFLSRCRAVLGVEAGVSIFDIEDKVRHACEDLLARNPQASFSDIENRILKAWENKIFYRTVSPRHFEAAAFRTCQILFEGKYSGILEPMVHYIPLQKDFSNIDFVMDTFQNKAERQRIQDNAYRDLIASGRFSYRRFVEAFDQRLFEQGFCSDIDENTAEVVTRLLRQSGPVAKCQAILKKLRYQPFPGRATLTGLAKKAMGPAGRIRYGS